jgi:hypothetical protein
VERASVCANVTLSLRPEPAEPHLKILRAESERPRNSMSAKSVSVSLVFPPFFFVCSLPIAVFSAFFS